MTGAPVVSASALWSIKPLPMALSGVDVVVRRLHVRSCYLSMGYLSRNPVLQTSPNQAKYSSAAEKGVTISFITMLARYET